MKLAIDTSIWIEYLKGTSKEIEHTIETKHLVTSTFAIAETADILIKKRLNPARAIQFMQTQAHIIPVDADIAIHAAHIKKKQRKTHPKFGLADAIHYATALRENATFLTRDKDFSNLKSTRIL